MSFCFYSYDEYDPLNVKFRYQLLNIPEKYHSSAIPQVMRSDEYFDNGSTDVPVDFGNLELTPIDTGGTFGDFIAKQKSSFANMLDQYNKALACLNRVLNLYNDVMDDVHQELKADHIPDIAPATLPKTVSVLRHLRFKIEIHEVPTRADRLKILLSNRMSPKDFEEVELIIFRHKRLCAFIVGALAYYTNAYHTTPTD